MIGYDFIPCTGLDISEILEKATIEGFSRLSFTFSEEHLKSLIAASQKSGISENDKFVIACLLKNASISSKGVLPLCQDTGIANIFGWVSDGFSLKGKTTAVEAITNGAKKVYTTKNLRFSTNSPKNFFDEKDPRNNMPPQVSIFTEDASLSPRLSEDFEKETGEKGLSLVLCAKGGGSSNKTTFIQGTKADLNSSGIEKLLRENIKKIGTSACPPYNLAFVAGGLSPEQNLLALKLATCGAYEKMTFEANDFGFRDKEIENLILKIASETGYGAQFGGSCFALAATAIRLPRHGASCPISIGVSCSAHRNLKMFVTKNGFYIEKTVSDVASLSGYKEAVAIFGETKNEIEINTNDGIEKNLSALRNLKAGTRVLISGKILVARDKAHARWKSLIDDGKEIPEYTKLYPICYAGPSETPENCVIGSFGPTTAGRMDSYADVLMSRNASKITIAKGNRSATFTEACKKYGSVYLGCPGGVAALIAEENIISQKILDYADLGMEAVRLVEVKNLPCFVLTNANGEDFYA